MIRLFSLYLFLPLIFGCVLSVLRPNNIYESKFIFFCFEVSNDFDWFESEFQHINENHAVGSVNESTVDRFSERKISKIIPFIGWHKKCKCFELVTIDNNVINNNRLHIHLHTQYLLLAMCKVQMKKTKNVTSFRMKETSISLTVFNINQSWEPRAKSWSKHFSFGEYLFFISLLFFVHSVVDSNSCYIFFSFYFFLC